MSDETRPTFPMKAASKAPSGTVGFDKITGGGLPVGRTTLLVGGPGSSRIVTDKGTKMRFRLYVAGNAHNSVQALANLTALCREFLPDQHEIEIIDVFQDPKRALAEGIFMTPTLVRVQPLPALQVVGPLREQRTVLLTLGLTAPTENVDKKRQYAHCRAGDRPGAVGG